MGRLLVTGGAGHVGSSLVERLLDKTDHEVTVLDNLSTGSLRKLACAEHPRCEFIKGDVNELRDVQEVMLSRRFEAVFHLAAVVGVERTQAHPIAVLRDIEGIRHLLNLCKNTRVDRFFFASSSEVYGEPVHIPQHEQLTPLNSRVPYAVVKNLGEAYARSFQQEYGVDYTVFRFFNTYGPKQSTDFVVSRFVAAALRGDDITIFGDGQQSRTFCYVTDTVDTCIATLTSPACVNDVINVGNCTEVSVLELAELVLRLTGSSSRIVHHPPLPDGDMKRRQPDNAKMVKLLGRDLIDLEAGLQLLLADEFFLSTCSGRDAVPSSPQLRLAG